jgi:hypothetical protein
MNWFFKGYLSTIKELSKKGHSYVTGGIGEKFFYCTSMFICYLVELVVHHTDFRKIREFFRGLNRREIKKDFFPGKNYL